MVAELYEFYIARKNPILGPWHFGQQDDLTAACPVCFAGARRVSAPIIDYAEAAERPVVQAHHSIFFVHESIKELMESAGLKGFMLTKAIDCRQRLFPFGYYELKAARELPPMANSSMYCRDQVCKRCGRGGYTVLGGPRPREIHYSKEGLKSLPSADFYLTWEFWGSPDWIPRKIYPHQDLIVGSQFKELLESRKIRLLKYPPVIIE